MDRNKLAELAIEAKKLSYSPYSNFKVGAALLTKDGKVYKGANIENAAYGSSMCAERTALYSAMVNGDKEFEAIAIAGDAEVYTPPCGSCRQVMLELGGKELEVILVAPTMETKTFKLSELIPFSFDDGYLKK
ncbi:MAG: cytidine deaminase [Bacteroidetes bacterium]|nr:cytidine deaminase [Bacteroidota bacterium]